MQDKASTRVWQETCANIDHIQHPFLDTRRVDIASLWPLEDLAKTFMPMIQMPLMAFLAVTAATFAPDTRVLLLWREPAA